MKLHLLIYCVYSLCLWTVHSQGARPNERVSGPDILVTDGTRNLTLTCPAENPNLGKYTWFTPGTIGTSDKTRCETRQSGKVCIFIPRVDDDNRNVTCTLVAPGPVISSAFYQVNLQYPPRSSPSIAIEQRRTEPLKQGDVITCTVSGGKHRVTNVTFHCQDPDHADQDDDVSDDGRNVSSSIRVNLSNTTGVYMNCTCSATWQPEPDLYSDKTVKTFLLQTSPRIMDNTNDPLNPPILETTGHTFFLVANPTPDHITYYFLRTNKVKERVPENTFKTQFTSNSSMAHLLNCRVTPQNVPTENVGLYDMYLANGLGDLSLRFNVTSPVAMPQDENPIFATVAIGVGIGVAVLVGCIVGIVIIRRKPNSCHKGHHDSQNRNRINDGPSSAGGNTTAVRCSTGSKGYASVGDTSLQGSNKAATTRHNNVPTTGYEDVELDMLGAPKIKNTPEKPKVDASISEDSAERSTDPKDYVYTKVAPKQNGDNQPIA